MQNVALEGAIQGLRANTVLPGIVDTEMVAGDDPEHREALNQLHPIGRLGQPAEIAEVVVGVLENPWLTGASIPIDGGLLLGTHPHSSHQKRVSVAYRCEKVKASPDEPTATWF